jgi:hypothetical protein
LLGPLHPQEDPIVFSSVSTKFHVISNSINLQKVNGLRKRRERKRKEKEEKKRKNGRKWKKEEQKWKKRRTK